MFKAWKHAAKGLNEFEQYEVEDDVKQGLFYGMGSSLAVAALVQLAMLVLHTWFEPANYLFGVSLIILAILIAPIGILAILMFVIELPVYLIDVFCSQWRKVKKENKETEEE